MGQDIDQIQIDLSNMHGLINSLVQLIMLPTSNFNPAPLFITAAPTTEEALARIAHEKMVSRFMSKIPQSPSTPQLAIEDSKLRDTPSVSTTFEIADLPSEFKENKELLQHLNALYENTSDIGTLRLKNHRESFRAMISIGGVVSITKNRLLSGVIHNYLRLIEDIAKDLPKIFLAIMAIYTATATAYKQTIGTDKENYFKTNIHMVRWLTEEMETCSKQLITTIGHIEKKLQDAKDPNYLRTVLINFFMTGISFNDALRRRKESLTDSSALEALDFQNQALRKAIQQVLDMTNPLNLCTIKEMEIEDGPLESFDLTSHPAAPTPSKATLTEDDNIVLEGAYRVNIQYQYQDEDITAILNARILEHNSTAPAGAPHFVTLGAVYTGNENELFERLQSDREHHHGKRILLIPCNIKLYHWVGLLFEFNESNQLLRAEHIDSIAGGTLPTTYQAQLSASYEGRKLQHRSDLILQDDYTSCGACMIENLFLSAKREARPKTIKMSSIRSGHLAALERYPNEPGISDALRSSRAEFLSKFNARQLSNTPSPSFDNHQASSSVLISLTAQKDRAEIAEREATEAVARALAATTPLRTAESAAAKQVIEARLSVVAAKAVVASLKTVLDEGIAAQSEFLACHREKLEIRITQKRLEGEAAAEELAAQKAKKRADKKDASPADRSLAEQAAARASHAVTLAAEVKATGDALKVKKAALKNKAAVASAEAGAVRSKYTAAKATETAAEANEAAIVAISQQASQMLLAATLQVSKAQKTLSTAKLLTTTLTASLAETTHEHYLRKTILKSSLPTLQVAAELLGGLIPSFIKPRQTNKPLVLVDVLPDATSPFTPFHKQIYDLFLVRNRGMYTRPNWTSWFWIAKANMEPFRLLYKKVNTLLCHIYPSKGEILVSVVQGIDLQLVDHLLEKAMAYYHEHFYKDQTVAFCSKDRDKSYFSIVDDGGESLSLTLSKEFLPFANSSLSKAYEETSTERAQLAAERDTLRADLSTRDATIAKLSSAVATKDATIAEQVATIAELRSTGLMKDTTIAEQGAMIAKLSSAVATKDATIARLSSAVATKDAEIAGFGGECTRLREERLAMSASIDQIALAVRQKDDEIARLRRELEIARRHSGTPGFFPPTPAASEASTAAPGTSASRVV